MGKKIAKWEIEREKFVNEVIDSLNKGFTPWRKEWEYNFKPHNPVTNTIYKGGNAIRLFVKSISKNYDDDRFLTFLQAKEKGWNVKAGAIGIPIEKFMLYDKATKKTFNPEIIEHLSSREKEEYESKNVFPMVKVFHVFNGSDVEGIPPFEKEKKEVNFDKIDTILNNSGMNIIYGGGEAYYQAKLDEIHLPEKNLFKSEQAFYSTVLHELAHGTGHETRFNRDLTGRFGSPSYSKEELIAELSSVFSGMKLPLKFDNTVLDNSKAYLQSWAKSLKDNSNLLFEASKEAEKVSEHIVKLQKQHNNDIFKKQSFQEDISHDNIVTTQGIKKNPLVEKIQERREQEKQKTLNRGI